MINKIHNPNDNNVYYNPKMPNAEEHILKQMKFGKWNWLIGIPS